MTYLFRQTFAIVAALAVCVAADMVWAALNLPMGFGT